MFTQRNAFYPATLYSNELSMNFEWKRYPCEGAKTDAQRDPFAKSRKPTQNFRNKRKKKKTREFIYKRENMRRARAVYYNSILQLIGLQRIYHNENTRKIRRPACARARARLDDLYFLSGRMGIKFATSRYMHCSSTPSSSSLVSLRGV